MVGLFTVEGLRSAGDAEPGCESEPFLGELVSWLGEFSGDRDGNEVRDFAEFGPGVTRDCLRDRTRTVPGR